MSEQSRNCLTQMSGLSWDTLHLSEIFLWHGSWVLRENIPKIRVETENSKRTRRKLMAFYDLAAEVT